MESKNFVGESGKVFEGEGFASDGGGLAHVFKDGEDVVLGDVVDAGVGKAVDKGFASLVEGSPDDLEHGADFGFDLLSFPSKFSSFIGSIGASPSLFVLFSLNNSVLI